MDEGKPVSCFRNMLGQRSKRRARPDVVSPDPGNISPLSSLNSVASEDAIKALRLDRQGSVKGIKIDLLKELAEERVRVQNLEQQLSTALSVNEELKLAASLSKEDGPQASLQRNLQIANNMVLQERKEKEELQMQLAAAKREAGALRAALNAARVQRDDLEAELMEAALDMMNSHKLQTDHAVLVRNEQAAKAAAEAAAAEAEALRHKLRVSEAAREAAEEKLRMMDMDAHDWELALDNLQERLQDALLKRPGLDSMPLANYSNYMPDTPSPTYQDRQYSGHSSLSADVLLNEELSGDSNGASSSSISIHTQSDLDARSEEAEEPKQEPWRQVVVQRPVFRA